MDAAAGCRAGPRKPRLHRGQGLTSGARCHAASCIVELSDSRIRSAAIESMASPSPNALHSRRSIFGCRMRNTPLKRCRASSGLGVLEYSCSPPLSRTCLDCQSMLRDMILNRTLWCHTMYIQSIPIYIYLHICVHAYIVKNKPFFDLIGVIHILSLCLAVTWPSAERRSEGPEGSWLSASARPGLSSTS